MPELLNQSLYDATYKATESVVKSTKANFKTFQTELTVGTALYRYSTKQYSDGKEAGARKNWTKLEDGYRQPLDRHCQNGFRW